MLSSADEGVSLLLLPLCLLIVIFIMQTISLEVIIVSWSELLIMERWAGVTRIIGQLVPKPSGVVEGSGRLCILP